jgi:hypothetical protein
MTTLEELNQVMAAHDCNASAPTVISPLAASFDMPYPGVLVVGDSIDVFNKEPPGGPPAYLVCHSAWNVSAVLNAILETRRETGKPVAAVVARVDDHRTRESLSEDLAARLHIRLEIDAPLSSEDARTGNETP